jgi:hypothetical protein
MLFLNLFRISLAVFAFSCHPGNKDADLLKKFVRSHHAGGSYIVVIDLDVCASCHYKDILGLCAMECDKLLLLVHSTNRAKERILRNDCQSNEASINHVHFFSDKNIMRIIHGDENGSMYLLSKQDNEISKETLGQLVNITRFCH